MVKGIDCADDPLAKLRPKEQRKKRRKGSASKEKGKRGERYFAEILTEISGLNFQRIYTSGAAVGKSNRDRLVNLTVGQAEQQLGDIASPETLRQMLVWESKFYADLDLHNVIGSEDGSRTFSGWVGEMMYDVESALTTMRSQRPVMGFLCVKLTRTGAWIAVNVKGFLTAFGVRASLAAPYVVFEHEPRPALAQYGWGRQWVLEDFDRFVSRFTGDYRFGPLNIMILLGVCLAGLAAHLGVRQIRLGLHQLLLHLLGLGQQCRHVGGRISGLHDSPLAFRSRLGSALRLRRSGP